MNLTFKSLKVKYSGAVADPIYDFPLVFNSNIQHNSAPSQNSGLQTLILRINKVKFVPTIGLCIYDSH